MGWSGDISVFSRTATFLADMPRFLRTHLLAMRDVQGEDGRFPDIAPLGGGFGGILWGSAGITVAWESYRQYGDKDMLAEHYEAMKRYLEYLIRDIDPHTGVLKEKERGQGSSLGDWLSPEYDKTEKTLLWEAYFIYDLELMRDMASILDNKEDEKRFHRIYLERKDFFNKTYLDARTGKTTFRGKVIDTQTSYALPLAFNVLDEKNKEAALPNFVAAICPSYSLMTGFIGTAWISKALSDNGYSDIAYRLLQQTTYPSWLYPVEQGATTIWERLDSYTHTDGFGDNNRMNSFNHYSFGSVGAWMYNYSLGIERDVHSPGFKHFFLQPEPDPTGVMTHAKGHYDSMYGRIESGWEMTGKHCRYHFTVPANTSATLYLKALDVNVVTGIPSKEMKYLGEKCGKLAFELQPGSYDIQMLR
jgi:alpha-L-rhamnosidase